MNSLEIICGTEQISNVPWRPYDSRICDFLDDWSALLRRDREAKGYSDVLTFAFWIRKGNIQRLKEEYAKREASDVSIGRGLAFHISPSNVPVNCMYTYVFGLLSGNANIVRVPSKSFPQVDILCRVLEDVLNREKYQPIKERTLIVRYDRASNDTKEFSAKCNLRVIWGGDETIRQVRECYLMPRGKEITFADRYSFGIISQKAVEGCTEQELHQLAEDFYNDTFLMDQNACSTPHLILWWRDGSTDKDFQSRFWSEVSEVAKKYDLADIKVSEKFADLCECVATNSDVKSVQCYGNNLLYVCTLDKLDGEDTTLLRGRYGLFYQYDMEQWDEINSLNEVKVQTLAYFGMDASKIANWIVNAGLLGIDRIVPFGKTLDIELIWDGYDLISEMSRIIAVR